MPEPLAPWTDARVDRLRELYAAGLSAAKISADLGGTTRNACIGLINRLGLPRRGASGSTSAQATALRATRKLPIRPNIAAGKVKRTAMLLARPRAKEEADPGNPIRQAGLAILEATNRVDLPVSKRVTIMALTPTSCRFPLGDPSQPGFGFCGKPALDPNNSYCPSCSLVAYVPRELHRRRAA